MRFPDFEGDWQEKKLGDFAPLQRGFDLPVDKIEDGKYPVVFSNGILKFHNEYKVKGPGIVTGRSGTIGKVSFVEENYWPHNTSLWVTAFNRNEPKFIYHYYSKYNLDKLGTGSGVPTLNRNDVHIQKDYFPQFEEQRKISKFLSILDQRISTQSKIIEELIELKTAIVKELFDGKSKFKNTNGNFPSWEKKKLREISKEHQHKNPNNQYSEVFSVSKHKGVINQIQHLGRSFSAKEIKHYKIAYPGDLIYTKSPTSEFPYGIIKQNRTTRIGVVSPLYCVFTPKTYALGYLLNEYFNSSVNTFNYLNPLVQKGAKNTMNINNEAFLNGAQLLLPTDEVEQNKIYSFLCLLSERIEAEQNLLKKYENQKKYLLKNLFT